MTQPYAEAQPERSAVDALRGAAVVDFGTNWCGYCRAAQPEVDAALEKHPQVSHLKVEDGPGRPLGRSFRVKLWPTLVLMDKGQEIGRVVRPNDAAEIEALFSGAQP